MTKLQDLVTVTSHNGLETIDFIMSKDNKKVSILLPRIPLGEAPLPSTKIFETRHRPTFYATKKKYQHVVDTLRASGFGQCRDPLRADVILGSI